MFRNTQLIPLKSDRSKFVVSTFEIDDTYNVCWLLDGDDIKQEDYGVADRLWIIKKAYLQFLDFLLICQNLNTQHFSVYAYDSEESRRKLSFYQSIGFGYYYGYQDDGSECWTLDSAVLTSSNFFTKYSKPRHQQLVNLK